MKLSNVTCTIGLGTLLLSHAAPAATFTKNCLLVDGGDACVYDFETNARAALQVCTRPGTNGDLVRTTLGPLGGRGVTAVGGGNPAQCSGVARYGAGPGDKFVAAVTIDSFSDDTWPKSATVEFTGPLTGAPVQRPEGSGGGGDGQLKVVQCETEGQTITVGTLVLCQLDPSGDVDTFRFYAPQNANALFRVSGVSYDEWHLFNPSGTEICSSSSWEICRNLPASGIYTVLVRSYYDYTGNYGLLLQGLTDGFVNDRPITFGDTKSADLVHAAQMDVWRFAGKQGQTVTIGVSGVNYDLWELYDSTARFLDSSSSIKNVQLPSDGVYRIVVYSYYGYTGTYKLTLNHTSEQKQRLAKRVQQQRRR